MMKQTLGNYLTQLNKDFPLDCSTLDYLQNNIIMMQMLGLVSGDKIILSGCELSEDKSTRSEGYVFLRTNAQDSGEVIYFEGGVGATLIHVKETSIPVTVQDFQYTTAYTERTLVPGAGPEQYSWEDFEQLVSTQELNAALLALQKKEAADIVEVAPPPYGTVHMFAGSIIPDNYHVCDGTKLKIADYPKLYASIGKQFNNGKAPNGTTYMTEEGYFRLPDLRSKFIVGKNDEDADYNAIGAVGGEKDHVLTIDEIPSHSHNFNDYYYREQDASTSTNYIPVDKGVGSNGGTDEDNTKMYFQQHATDTTGGGLAHENRPPFYVLTYIIRIS